jgi:putative ABC transport system permease protein
MKTLDLLDLASRNIRESRLRNALTAMGIAVGVASLVSMLSLGIGLQRLASSGIERSGLFDTLTVTSAAGGRGGFGPNVPAVAARTLDDSALRDLAKLPEAREVYPNLSISAEWKASDGVAHNASGAAIPLSVRTTDQFSGIKGRFFSSAQAAEVVLTKQFAAELSSLSGVAARTVTLDSMKTKWLGQHLTFSYPERTPVAGGGFNIALRSQTVEVVGLIDSTNAGRPGGDRLYLPLGYVEGLHVMQGTELRDVGSALNGPVYQAIVVRLKNPSRAATAEAAIKAMGFNTFSALDAASSLRQVFAVVDLFLGAFGSLALAVSSIGIVNTLVMAILERRREIGIMKAIGASDTDIRRIFLAEAAVLGLVGGVLGVLIGWAIGTVINFGTNVFIQRQGLPAQQIWFVPWWLVFGALAFSLVASLLSGAYPASRAAKLEPLEALRYE